MPPRKAAPAAAAIPDITSTPEAQNAAALAEAPVSLPAVIESDAQFEEVTEITRQLAERRRQIEEVHKELKRPILEAGRRIDEFFRVALSKLKPYEDAGRDALVVYKQRRDAEIAAARRAAEAAQREQQFRPGSFGSIRELSTAPAQAPVQAAGFATRKSYSAVVTNMAALVAHCAATNNTTLLLPNQRVLDEMAKQARDERPLDIPGVEIQMTETAVLR